MICATRELEARIVELEHQVGQLVELSRRQQATIQRQETTIEDLLRRLYGRKSERLHPDQILMDGLIIDATGMPAPAEPELPEAAEPSTPRRKRRHPGRTPFPEHLPHEEVIIPVPEEEKVCPESGLPRKFMGYEESRKLEYVSETLKVVVIKREKWGSPVGAEEEGVVIAPRPASAVECMAAPGLLSHVMVSKFEDHMPFYRMERTMGRQGVKLTRQTMASWAYSVARAVDPIVELMRQRILAGHYVHHDDTPVKMLDPGAGKTKETRLWVAVGGDAQQYIHFEFTTNRSKDGPVDFFRDYAGYLMCDEYGGYVEVCSPATNVTGLSCWAHARRYFDKAKHVYFREATRILAMIAQLYRIEKEYRDEGLEALGKARLEQSVPQLARIHEALVSGQADWLPASPMAKAADYVLKRWDAFCRYTSDPRLPIDNNPAERAIRSVAIGRKNWLFLGSENGGQTAATLMSLIGTAHHLRLNTWEYLRDVLERIPHTPEDQLHRLLPDVWRDERASAGP